ncbi:hypothetical protein [Virgibacillus salexigens]|uniref:Uncharacterized protein n=1 Tax=Virgibacillus kapii TaxID=1638645 RepID=A0ABQ2DCP4_9BACI|nr:hypothetical protein [Virgibacillus kapii]GGJ51086.1 hypothetical protein GCM10007111_11640 [Virgibacillus kapii]
MSKVIFECSKCKAELKANGDSPLMDGLNCPVCRGSLSLVNKYNNHPDIEISEEAFDIRRKIVNRNLHYCRDVTAQQMETIIRLIEEHDNRVGIDFATGKDYTVTNYYKGAGGMYTQRLIDERLKRLDSEEEYLKEAIEHLKEEEKEHQDKLQKIKEEREELQFERKYIK